MRRLSLNRYVFVLWVILTGIPASLSAQERVPPFSPGERLRFELKWGLVSAGEAVLEVLPIETVNNTSAYHFVLTASSNSFVDVFYKVRDRIDSYIDLSMTHSLRYQKKQEEGRTQRDIVVHFDWEKGETRYSNHNVPKPPIELLPGTFDPLGVFYYTRMLDLTVNAVFEHPVSDGRKTVMGQARVIKRETITVNGAPYDTFLIEPELKDIGGVFQKSKDAKIQLWVTADERRLLVRLKSKVAVGSFVGNLIEIANR